MVKMNVLNDCLRSIVNAERFIYKSIYQDKAVNKFLLDLLLKLLSNSYKLCKDTATLVSLKSLMIIEVEKSLLNYWVYCK